jgi:predicted permease
MALACAGGAAGLLLAHLVLTIGAPLLAGQVPRADELSIDWRVLLFAAGVSVLTGLLAGALPALRAARADVNDALKEGGRGDAGTVGSRSRRLLIVGEVAVSVVLLAGAGMMLRTLQALRNVDAGFTATGVLTMNVSLPDARYATAAAAGGFFDEALRRLRALPGVEAAGAVDSLPTTGGSVQPIVLEGHAERLPSEQPTVAVRKITPGYVRAMRIPVFQGRDVVDTDEDVLLVSRSAAKLLWGGQNPIGRRATLPLEKSSALRVVGVVGEVKDELSEPAAATVYEYQRERPWKSLSLVMRTSVPPSSVATAATAALHAIDSEQPIEDVRPMQDVVDERTTSQRFSALLLGTFAAVALVLASVGIYSVLSFVVRGRTREIGIRTALGAGTGDVLALVLREGMMPALGGIAAGLVAALAAARLLDRLAFGATASDPLTLGLVAGTLALVSLAASLVPAYRAARLDPADVLR